MLVWYCPELLFEYVAKIHEMTVERSMVWVAVCAKRTEAEQKKWRERKKAPSLSQTHKTLVHVNLNQYFSAPEEFF